MVKLVALWRLDTPPLSLPVRLSEAGLRNAVISYRDAKGDTPLMEASWPGYASQDSLPIPSNL